MESSNDGITAKESISNRVSARTTEAKRVTVLEIHRRIYLLLMELESSRGTKRERDHLIDGLPNEIDLL